MKNFLDNQFFWIYTLIIKIFYNQNKTEYEEYKNMNTEQTITGVICGTGACVPERVMDNHEIAEFVDTSDQWIRERTGVVRRHIAEKETTVSMAAEAGRQAIKEAGINPEEIDLIILATASPDQIFPCTACRVQEILGAVNASGFDLNAACSGFLFAYNTAQAYISVGVCRTVLVIGAECLSRLVNWKDRNTCILFGDGAGAVLLKAEKGTAYFPSAHSDGSGGNALTCSGMADIQMNGKEVFQFAIRKVPQVIEEVLKKNNLTKEQIDWFVLHQANSRIVDAVARRLKADIEKFPMNLQEYGNTSSASIPVLLNELNRKGVLFKGQKIVLAGFGAGLSWGAGILEWGIPQNKTGKP